ncbi:MAG: anti-sigma factor [Leptolyngbyaceae bacterium]|nr:anti-sigma factor [Leptolyngbyaceae bacterium]
MNESSMPSSERQRLIAGYVLYDLTPDEAATLEAWAAADPAIAQEIAHMQQALELTYAPPEVQPPPHLRDAVLNAHRLTLSSTESRRDSVTETPVFLPGTAPAHSPMGDRQNDAERAQRHVTARRRWGRGFGAVAAALIVGLGISNVILWRSLQETRLQLAQTQGAPTRAVSLTSTDDAGAEVGSAQVTIKIDEKNLRAVLGTQDLPPLPEGQVYVLWTVLQPDAPFTTDSKDAILTQAFTVDEQGTVSTEVPLPSVYQDFRWIKALAITIESADAPQRHESSPILIEML